MTEKAVNQFVGRAVISDEFRNKLTSGRITREEIAAAVAGLDPQDVNAIFLTSMTAGDFPQFNAALDEYLNLRYRGGAASGDDLPISV